MIPARQNSNTILRQVILSLSVALSDIPVQAASMPEGKRSAGNQATETVCVQTGNTQKETCEPDLGSQKKATTKEKRGEIVIAPIPISSPAIGSGLLLGFGYVFLLSKNDKVSPPLSEEWAFAPTTKAKAV